MTPAENGRHCEQCSKIVTDFTAMTNQQIITHLATSNNVCGRFGVQQLSNVNLQLRDEQPKNSLRWNNWIMTIALLGITAFNKAGAQQKENPHHRIVQTDTGIPKPEVRMLGKIAITQNPNPIKIVSGRIVAAEDSLPVPAVTVRVKGTAIQAMSDVNGKYTITIPKYYDTLEFRFIGYETKEVKVNKLSGGPVNVSVVLHTMMMGDVVVGGVSSRQSSLMHRIWYKCVKKPVRKIFK